MNASAHFTSINPKISFQNLFLWAVKQVLAFVLSRNLHLFPSASTETINIQQVEV